MCWPKKQIKTNQVGQATRLWICHCQAIQIRVFHITWITFFVCFFGWFATANLYIQISADLGLTKSDKAIGGGCAVASTVIFRVIFGWLCDKIGSKKSYVLLLILSAFPIACMALVTSPTGYIITSLFIGIVGASFVITQYHTMAMFAGKTVGTATATATGWGNFGGGCANFIMPILYFHIKDTYKLSNSAAWRICMLIPGLSLFVIAIIYWFFTVDKPPIPQIPVKSQSKEELKTINECNGSASDLKITKSNSELVEAAGFRQSGNPNLPEADMEEFKIGAKDYRTWILFFVYAACFGIELTVLGFTVDYFMYSFGAPQEIAGFIVLCFSFSNLFARSIGGIVADVLHKFSEKSLMGRVYALFIVSLWEGIFLILFSLSEMVSNNLAYPIFMLVMFSFGVQAAEGVTFAIVPFIQPKAIGPVAGIVAAGGNVGAMVFAFAIFTNVPHNISYFWAWLILGLFVFIVSFTVLCIRFSDEEIRAADAKSGTWTGLEDDDDDHEEEGCSKYCPFI